MTDADRAPADIRILAGNPTPEELAAVTAVLSVAIEQLAEQSRTEDSPPSAWMRTRRPMRHRLTGDWRHPTAY